MKKKFSAVVLVVKNEAADIAWWLAWYNVLGIDTCIVFDDQSTDYTSDIVTKASYVQDIRIESVLRPWNDYFYERQQRCYRYAIEKYGNEFEWIGFFDADEYLFTVLDNDIPSLLKRYPEADGLAINWCNYGSSGHILKPKGPPIEAYVWHSSESHAINRHVKSFIRPSKLGKSWINVHGFDIDRNNYLTASGNRFSWSSTIGVINEIPDWNFAKIMHYQCRSMENFVERLKKRPELSVHSNLWKLCDVNEVKDELPLRHISSLKSQVSRIDAANLSRSTSTSSLPSEPKMESIRNDVVRKLWRGADPFLGFPKNLYQPDTQGWGFSHPYLAASVHELRPTIIVEIGVWKGASTIAMASTLRDLQINGVVIAIDTWLGAWDHWTNDEWFSHLGFDHGYPSISRKFMNNVISADLQDYVVPLPLDSLNAVQVLKHLGIRPNMIHIDGAHDFESVFADLHAWWPQLEAGGLLIGDDYYPDTHWPGVKQAFHKFFGYREDNALENIGGKCRIFKPLNKNLRTCSSPPWAC